MTIQNIISKIIMVLVVLLAVIPAIAQPPSLPGDPTSAPVDGGLSLLVAGGIGYGVKKLRKKKKPTEC
jgi:hypothetical protein